jgi:HSP20 family protein
LAVYDYSFTIGPESKSKVREFLDIGNFRSFDDDNYISRNNNNTLDPQFTSAKEREPLVDIITSNKKVKVVLEMPLVDKKDIKIKAYTDVYNNSHVEIYTDAQNGEYHRVIDIPSNADINSVKSTYRNGILEIVFCKKRRSLSSNNIIYNNVMSYGFEPG